MKLNDLFETYKELGMKVEQDKRTWIALGCLLLVSIGLLYYLQTKPCAFIECYIKLQGFKIPTTCEFVQEKGEELLKIFPGGVLLPAIDLSNLSEKPTTTQPIKEYKCPDCPVCPRQQCPRTTNEINTSEGTSSTVGSTTTSTTTTTIETPIEHHYPTVPIKYRLCHEKEDCTWISCPCPIYYGGKPQAINKDFVSTFNQSCNPYGDILNNLKMYCYPKAYSTPVVACMPKYASNGDLTGNFCTIRGEPS